MIVPRRSYLVCATPRSGSTLLCELLKDTGVAGRPEEYFEALATTGAPPHPGHYLADLPRTGAGIRDDDTPPEAPWHSSLAGLSSYRDHLERTFELGTTPNGIFGTKLMWRQIAELEALATELPEYTGLRGHELLEKVFGGPAYIWISRREKVRQAVSMWRALQTRSWRLGGGRGVEAEQLHYSFRGIDHLVKSLEAEDKGWSDFFAQHGIDGLAISYEDDLDPDRQGTIASVLSRVGVVIPRGWQAADPVRRQADALSEEWVAAYHRDSAERASEADAAAISAS